MYLYASRTVAGALHKIELSLTRRGPGMALAPAVDGTACASSSFTPLSRALTRLRPLTQPPVEFIQAGVGRIQLLGKIECRVVCDVAFIYQTHRSRLPARRRETLAHVVATTTEPVAPRAPIRIALLDGAILRLEAHEPRGGDCHVGERVGDEEGEGALDETELVWQSHSRRQLGEEGAKVGCTAQVDPERQGQAATSALR